VFSPFHQGNLTKIAQHKAGLFLSKLPGLDEFSNWVMFREAEKLTKEMTLII
jgi:hypothetical protein